MKADDAQLEIAHVVFIDIVGYSKLLTDQQRELFEQLNQIVRKTEPFRSAEAAGKLVRLPTGDGMALAFFTSPDAPLRCALEIAQALKNNRQLPLRMGIHSGPVDVVTDVNDRANVAGAGINVAQRVMDCGDAGHILLSKRVADDLAQYSRWQPYLHELGEVEVKHGVLVSVVNFYSDDIGNPMVPGKVQRAREQTDRAVAESDAATRKVVTAATARRRKMLIAAAVLVTLLTAAGFWLIAQKTVTKGIAAVATTLTAKGIAVLPFANLSEQKENAFFADGVQDEILTDLSRIADLKVISRSSVMQYKESAIRNLRVIAGELGVAYLLEGSVQRAAGKVRVIAQLIDARTDSHVWAKTYDRPLDDVFAVQSEIAQAIAEQLQAQISPQEKAAIEEKPTSDLVAFELYSQAKDILLGKNTGESEQAIDLLNQAVTRDPSFFQAYLLLADSHEDLYRYGYDHTPARLAKAEAALQEASRLRPEAGETYLARSWYLYAIQNYAGALAELEIAEPKIPNNARLFAAKASIQRRQGHYEESTRNWQRAIELDPRNTGGLVQLGLSYLCLRRYADQKSVLDRAVAIQPNNLALQAQRAAVELNWKADTQPLHQLLDSIRATNPSAAPGFDGLLLHCALAERNAATAREALSRLGEETFNFETVHFTPRFMEGLIARMTNDDQKAQSAFAAARAEQEKVVQAQPDYGPALCVLGLIDAALGRKEQALREGRRAVELLPVEKDSGNGQLMIQCLAMIAAWAGEKDLACEQLARALRYPGNPTSFVTHGDLKLTPWWDPLRGEPCFEKIIEEAKHPLAPK